MKLLHDTNRRVQVWIADQMCLSDKSSMEFRSVYNEDIIKEGVEFQEKTFYEISDKQRRRRLEILLDVLTPCQEDVVLDLGCGVGTFAFYSAKNGARAVGIDYSIEAIKMARLLCARYKPATDPLFLVADATKLPFKGTPFNKVICADFVEHISDSEKKQVMDEIMRILASGLVIVYTPNCIREVIGFLFNCVKSLITRKKVPVNPRHFGLTTRAKFEKILCNYDSILIHFRYIDEERPYLANIPLLGHFLALKMLWRITKSSF